MLVIGQTGRGKTTFINTLVGLTGPNKLQTSSSQTSCTSSAHVVAWGNHVVIDTPGTGDIPSSERPQLTNEDIFTLILVEAQKYDIVCVVMMIGLEELETRNQVGSMDLVAMLTERFSNLGALIEFGFKDELGIVNDVILTAAYQKNPQRYSSLCLSLSNVHVCQQLDFSKLSASVHKAISRPNALVLNSRSFKLRCSKCFLSADPLLVSAPCMNHGNSGAPVHGGTEWYHRDIRDNYHSGHLFKRNSWADTEYTCCARGMNGQGCKIAYMCCKRDDSGCRTRCQSCRQDTSSPVCKSTCSNCGKLTSTNGCLKSEHDWRRD